MKSVLSIVALVAALYGSCVQAETAQPLQRVFKNWQVTCNNLNTCDIRNNEGPAVMTILYYAGTDGKASLTLSLPGGADVRQVMFDNQAFRLDSKQWQRELYEGDLYLATGDLALIQKFIKLAKHASTLSWSDDKDNNTLSLAGLSAGLLLVDERQGRIDNQSALLRIGTGSVKQVPAVPVVVKLNPPQPQTKPLADEEKLIAQVIKAQADLLLSEECVDHVQDLEKLTAEAYPLTDSDALVAVRCWTGAYQSSSIVFVVPRNAPELAQRLTVPLITITSELQYPLDMDIFTEVNYSPESAILSHAARGRGPADCGEAADWLFDGKQFQLISYHSQPHCNGGEPGDWPSLWQADNIMQ